MTMKSKMTLGLIILLAATGWAFGQQSRFGRDLDGINPKSTAATGWALGQQSKLGRDFNRIDPKSTVDVIIQYKHVPTEADHQWVRGQGGTVRRRYGRVRAGVYTVRASALKALANNPNVTYITPD